MFCVVDGAFGIVFLSFMTTKLQLTYILHHSCAKLPSLHYYLSLALCLVYLLLLRHHCHEYNLSWSHLCAWELRAQCSCTGLSLSLFSFLIERMYVCVLLQAEIVKRLSAICAQIIPFLSQEVRWQWLTTHQGSGVLSQRHTHTFSPPTPRQTDSPSIQQTASRF